MHKPPIHAQGYHQSFANNQNSINSSIVLSTSTKFSAQFSEHLNIYLMECELRHAMMNMKYKMYMQNKDTHIAPDF